LRQKEDRASAQLMAASRPCVARNSQRGQLALHQKPDRLSGQPVDDHARMGWRRPSSLSLPSRAAPCPVHLLSLLLSPTGSRKSSRLSAEAIDWTLAAIHRRPILGMRTVLLSAFAALPHSSLLAIRAAFFSHHQLNLRFRPSPFSRYSWILAPPALAESGSMRMIPLAIAWDAVSVGAYDALSIAVRDSIVVGVCDSIGASVCEAVSVGVREALPEDVHDWRPRGTDFDLALASPGPSQRTPASRRHFQSRFGLHNPRKP
jgi:hypothetical protein